MKSHRRPSFVAAFIAAAISLPSSVSAQVESLAPVVVEAPQAKLQPEQMVIPMQYVEIRNMQDEPLGRVHDLGIDLVNGRIVEVLVVSDDSLEVDNKIVAVPPLALLADPVAQVYRVNISVERFQTAAAIDLSAWEDAGRSDRVAAAYRLFGQPIYFLEEGQKADVRARRPKVALGYVERSSRILDMPISNRQDEKLGKVWSLSLDVPAGRILSVVVISQGNFKIKNVVPAMALSFNPARDGLVLDDTREELEEQPRYFFTAAAYGQDAYATEEAYTGPRTSEALEQGRSYRDIDQTVRINRAIRATGVDCRKVEVGTLHDRVTLRGQVATADEKKRVGDATILVSRPELVDNQIIVAAPAVKS